MAAAHKAGMTVHSVESAGIAGPNGLFQTPLDFRNGFEVRPGLTVQHSAESGVMEARSTGEGSDAFGTHCVAKADGEPARDLGDRVIAGDGGPGFGAQLSGSLPSRASHAISVDATSRRSAISSNVSASGQGGGYYHHGYSDSHLSDEVRVTLNNYVPYRTPKSEWLQLRDLVLFAVSQSWPYSVSEAHFRLSIAVMFAKWATSEAAQDADPDIFHAANVDRFVSTHLVNESATGRRNDARLRLVAAGALSESPVPPLLAGLAPVAQPYTPAECAQLASWGAGLRQEWRRRNASFILSFGLGAGLESSETRYVKGADIEDVDGLMVINVRGDNERAVPVRRFEAEEIRSALKTFQVDGFVLTDHARATKNLMDTMQGGQVKGAPNPRRLRSTWIVAHLNAQSPLPEFLAAAGLVTTASLTRYLPYVEAKPNASQLLSHAGGVQ